MSKELILATKEFASDSTARSWFYVLSTGFLLMAAVVASLYFENLILRLMSSVLIGLLILRSFVIYHDHQHRAILENSKLADVLMRVYGILTLNPSSIWKSSHNYHHKHNSKLRSAHIGSFPIMTKAKFETSSKADQKYYLFMRHPLTIFLGYFFIFLYGMCLKPFVCYPTKHYDCLIALIVHASIGFALVWYMGWSALFITLFLPALLAYAIGSYLFYAQHNFPGVTFSDHAGWTYEKAALESSSFLRTGKVMGWFSANIGYHHIHHLNPKIPFYRLPEAMEKIPEFQNYKSTSLSPSEIIRCLKLKVWDTDAQQMVSV